MKTAKTSLCKLMSWENFRETCRDDAYLWNDNGYTADELSNSDILGCYDGDYFADDPDDPETNERIDWNIENLFTPEDFCNMTRQYMREIEEEAAEEEEGEDA